MLRSSVESVIFLKPLTMFLRITVLYSGGHSALTGYCLALPRGVPGKLADGWAWSILVLLEVSSAYLVVEHLFQILLQPLLPYFYGLISEIQLGHSVAIRNCLLVMVVAALTHSVF